MKFHIMGRNKKSMGREKEGGRFLALLLCVALSMECVPITARAAEPEVEPVMAAEESVLTDEQEQPDTAGSGESQGGEAQNPDGGGGQEDEGSPDQGEDEISGEDGKPVEGQPQEPESGDSGEDVSGDPGVSGGAGEEQDPGENGKPQNPDAEKPGGEEKEEGPEQVSGNDTDSVSENDVSSVSDNDLPSVSGNSLDVERAELIGAARAAFDVLLSEKPLMALLYHADRYDARQKADKEAGKAASLEIGQTLYIQGVEITEDDVWYRVQYLLDGAEETGYVQSYYLAYSDEDWMAWEEEYLVPVLELGEGTYKNTAYGMRSFSMMTYAVDTSDISAFPGSYQDALRNLKNAHPDWTFVPMKTGLDFPTSVSREMGAKSLIQKTTSNAEKGWVGAACPSESGWYYATQPAVAYHMDPRNSLTETYIFQFEQLTFNASYHTESAVQTFLNNTFMKGKLADDPQGRTYAKAFYEIGSGRKLSPIHLASRVYQEQGQGTSGLISGTYPGYEGYYNFFNVGVNGSSTAEKIVKGLTYAKNKGWNTRYKSLEGGAATIGNNYILKGQDTIYLEKFNVNKNSPYGVYEHQYMQNIQAPRSESSSTKKMYASAGSLNSAFVFKIPVYNNMPDESGGTEEPGVPLRGITLDRENLTLRRPDTVVEDTEDLSEQEKAENISETTLQVRFDPADTTADKTIVWSSADTKVATVKADPGDSSRAVITAAGAGEVKITAKAANAGEQTAVCAVRVIAPVYRLELSDPGAGEGAVKTDLSLGQSIRLNAEYWPKDTTSDHVITWTSSNAEVATVNNGRVTAQGVGTAEITAAVAGYSASYEVSVKACRVIFHREDGTVWEDKELSLGYGSCVADVGAFPEMPDAAGKIFRGWYTRAGGQGSAFTADQPVYAEETHVYPHYQQIGAGKGFYVIPVGDQTYTGSAVRPKVRVFDSTVAPDGSLLASDGSQGGDKEAVLELVEGKDYTLSYKNNKNVNTEGKPLPTIIVKGKGNYGGTEYAYFNILPKALTDHDITADDVTVAYSGKVIKASPAVYRDGKKLAVNRDYVLSYPQTGTGAYSKTGVYPVVIVGKGGYTGQITVYEKITTEVLLSKASVAKIPNQIYSNVQMKEDGGIRPASLTVTYKKQPLVESTDGGRTGDYTVSYKNDAAIGTATATITAVEGSGYSGSKSVTYKIVGVSIAGAKVEGLADKEYVEIDNSSDEETYGNIYEKMQQTPGSYTLTLNDRILEESRDGVTGDYVVSYGGAAQKGAVRAGTATIIFRGINEYSGQLKKTYRIRPCEVREDRIGTGRDFTLSYYTQEAPGDVKPLPDPDGIAAPYVKGGSKPVVLLRFRGKELIPGKDYSISYKNNNALTTADMEERKLPAYTITGKGNFSGKLTGRFTITDGQFDRQIGSPQDNKWKITMTLSDVVYRGKKGAYRTKAVLKDVSGSALTAGKDYGKALRYTYETETEVLVLQEGVLSRVTRGAKEPVGEEDIPQAGTTIRVTAQGTGFYAGGGEAPPEISAVYRIVSSDFAKAKVKVAAKSYQDGRPVTLTAEDLTVTLKGVEEPLVCGKDYVIREETYVNHSEKGKAKVTLRGIGNYGGEKTITYAIGAKTLLWWLE